MKVKFSEGPDALNIPACGVIAERGKEVEVPDEIGKSLITQGWSEVGKSSPKPNKETK